MRPSIPSPPRAGGLRRPWLLPALLVALAGLAACGGSGSAPAPGPAARAAAADAAPAASQVARPSGPVEVFPEPGAGTPDMTLPPTTSFGSARALLVVGRVDGWLEVLLPTRPNGSTGWIRADGVAVRSVGFEVRVDLSDRSLEVLDAGRSVLRTPVAIGTPAAPTPTGRFSLVDKVDTGSTSSPYGPFALGLSAHSEVLTQFGGGDGQVAIHGTSDPSSIGRAASHGCVRVANDVITRLADLLPLGTPVVVVG